MLSVLTAALNYEVKSMAYTYKDITEMLATVTELENADQMTVANHLEKFAKTQLNRRLSADLDMNEKEAIEFMDSLLGE